MFTGIIASLGEVTSLDEINGGCEIEVTSKSFFADSKMGDSVAVNGICLTITEFTQDTAVFFAQIETMDKTTLGSWIVGDTVNLEHPLRLSDRLGGHLVQGHVDGVACVEDVKNLPDGSVRASVSIPLEFLRFIVEKGSICLNGVSLTVASRDKNICDVALIPATLEKTTFSNVISGDMLNLEIDCIARYVEQLLDGQSGHPEVKPKDL